MSRLQGLCLLILWSVCSNPARAVEAVVSYTVFHRTAANGSDSAYIEISWQIENGSIHYKKLESGELFSEIQTALSISNDTGIYTRDRFVLQTTPQLPAVASKQKILDLRRYPLPPGKWKLQLALGEKAFQKDTYIFQDSLEVAPYTKPAFSALQLLDTFFASNVPSPVLKGGYQQLPLPLSFLDEGRRQLHFYTELYTDRGVPGRLMIRYYYISRRPLDVSLYNIQFTDTVQDDGTVHPTRHSFDVGRLASGNYYLNAILNDTLGSRLTATSTFFQIVNKNPDAPPAVAADTSKRDLEAGKSNYFNLANTFVGKFNAAQLRAILVMILPQANPTEEATIKNFFRRPDDMYTRYFIYNYFGKYNKVHPEEAWKEFSDKVREVNREFNGAGTMGYETERGIIYLKYGKPDERIRVPNESGALPYEIWRYNAVGATSQVGLFLFYQPGSLAGDYRLLHSTVPGERFNPSWMGSLYVNGQASGMGNSRADQYFNGK